MLNEYFSNVLRSRLVEQPEQAGELEQIYETRGFKLLRHR